MEHVKHVDQVGEAFADLVTRPSSLGSSGPSPREDEAQAGGERALLLNLAAEVEAALEDDVPVSVVFVSRLAGRLRREAAEIGQNQDR